MSTPADPSSDPPPADPFALWRQIYAANERAWNAALERSLATPAFAEAQGKLLETFLQVQKTFREQVRTYLEAVNVPSREDIARLGELIVGLEEKVDQLADRLLDLEAAVEPLAAAARARPRSPGVAETTAAARAAMPEPPGPGGSDASRLRTAASSSAEAAEAADGTARRTAPRPRGRPRRARQEP